MSEDSTPNEDKQAPEAADTAQAPPQDDDTAQALAAFLKAEPDEPVEAAEEEKLDDAVSEALMEEFKAEEPKEAAAPVIQEIPEPEAEEAEAKAPEAAESDSVEDEDEELEEEPPLVVEPPDDGIKRRWYAVHCHSGQEATVQRSLQSKAEQEGLAAQMPNVLVPMERVAEFKSGEKKVSQRKFFPGYILVQLPEHPERHADLWHLIKDTPGVTGFIGSRNEPVPLEDSEVGSLLEEIRGERERPRAKVNFSVNERVKIIDGAFANFAGNVSEINAERGKLKVLIEIFERQTAVEVEFWQVEKI